MGFMSNYCRDSFRAKVAVEVVFESLMNLRRNGLLLASPKDIVREMLSAGYEARNIQRMCPEARLPLVELVPAILMASLEVKS